MEKTLIEKIGAIPKDVLRILPFGFSSFDNMLERAEQTGLAYFAEHYSPGKTVLEYEPFAEGIRDPRDVWSISKKKFMGRFTDINGVEIGVCELDPLPCRNPKPFPKADIYIARNFCDRLNDTVHLSDTNLTNNGEIFRFSTMPDCLNEDLANVMKVTKDEFEGMDIEQKVKSIRRWQIYNLIPFDFIAMPLHGPNYHKLHVIPIR